MAWGNSCEKCHARPAGSEPAVLHTGTDSDLRVATCMWRPNAVAVLYCLVPATAPSSAKKSQNDQAPHTDDV